MIFCDMGMIFCDIGIALYAFLNTPPKEAIDFFAFFFSII